MSEEYEPVKMHLASISPELLPGLSGAQLTGRRCVRSVLETYTSIANDTLGAQQILPQVSELGPDMTRVAVLIPHGAFGNGSPNSAYGWVGAKSAVEHQAAGYIQAVGQGPVNYHGPEAMWFQADPAAGTISISVFAYYFVRD